MRLVAEPVLPPLRLAGVRPVKQFATRKGVVISGTPLRARGARSYARQSKRLHKGTNTVTTRSLRVGYRATCKLRVATGAKGRGTERQSCPNRRLKTSPTRCR